MAEQWIDAATARQLVTAPPMGVSGLEALLERAHAGLVKIKARRLVMGDRQAEDVEAPSELWTLRQRAKLEQNWGTGDFSGRLDGLGDDRWQAFGVTFELSGIFDMLSFERRATTARALSVAGNSAWVTARSARKFAYEKAGLNPRHAAAAIISQGQLGFLTSRAVLAKRADRQRADGSTWEQREWDVPAWFWRNVAEDNRSLQDWELGNFTARGATSGGTYAIALSGVYFLAESLEVLMPAIDSAPVETPQSSKPGGRPAQPWWDDMWCAVWGLIHQGDFKPKTQADVERAMLTWATLNGHDVSDAAVRPKARKLLNALNSEARNFLDT